MADKYLDCCLEVGDNIRPFIQEGRNGKKYLYFKIVARKNGADQYGKTHTMSIRYKANDGQYYTQYIGDATEKEFQVRQPAPAPQGGYAPQPQAPAQGYAPQGYAPQAPAPAPQQYAQQNLPPQAPPPTYADMPADNPDNDLPFSSRPE